MSVVPLNSMPRARRRARYAIWSGWAALPLKNMCSYRCETPLNLSSSVIAPSCTPISTVTSGVACISETTTSSPSGQTWCATGGADKVPAEALVDTVRTMVVPRRDAYDVSGAMRGADSTAGAPGRKSPSPREVSEGAGRR